VAYLSIIRPYLCSLLPENTIKSGRFIVDTLYFLIEASFMNNDATSFLQIEYQAY
jgi:hypothetical protein